MGSDEGQKRLEALINAKDIKGLQSFKDPGGAVSEKAVIVERSYLLKTLTT